MKITVLIPTYNRNKCIFRLTQRLKTLEPKCKIVVVDDASPQDIEQDYIDVFYRFKKNNGRKRFWKMLNKLFALGRNTKADLFIMMVDDALPKNEFFTDAIRLWKQIKDPDKIAMHLANNGREQNWTEFRRREYNDEIFWTQTTEFSCLCRREFIQYRFPEIPLSRWEKNNALGSGIGPLINWNFINAGHTIYGVKISLLYQNKMCSESQMNKEERERHPWITK